MWFESRKSEMKRNHIKKWPKMDNGATALKDSKYLEAKDIANEVLQMKRRCTETSSNAENMLQKM